MTRRRAQRRQLALHQRLPSVERMRHGVSQLTVCRQIKQKRFQAGHDSRSEVRALMAVSLLGCVAAHEFKSNFPLARSRRVTCGEFDVQDELHGDDR